MAFLDNKWKAAHLSRHTDVEEKNIYIFFQHFLLSFSAKPLLGLLWIIHTAALPVLTDQITAPMPPWLSNSFHRFPRNRC